MFFDIQRAILNSWLQMAETSTKLLVESSAEFNRASTAAWMGTFESQRPATPLFPFSIPGLPGATSVAGFNPFQPTFNPLASVWGIPSPFASLFAPQNPTLAAWSAIMPWAAMTAMPNPFGQQPTFADVMAASYQSAGGHAAAAMVAPFTGHTVPALWWTQPAGRGWLN